MNGDAIKFLDLFLFILNISIFQRSRGSSNVKQLGVGFWFSSDPAADRVVSGC
jgi:hypothetical protein